MPLVLQNEICRIEINIDETYTVDSADNRHYDITLNPRDYRHNDFSKTLAIQIDLYSRKYQIELSRSYYSYDSDCAIIKDTMNRIQNDNMTIKINIIYTYTILIV